MSYELLSKAYYKDEEEYEQLYRERFKSLYSVHLNFNINGFPAFFLPTPEIYGMLTSILKTDKIISELCGRLPRAAIHQFSRRCLIDEIVLTNSIEGVRSTRKEINDILDELEVKSKGKRFDGLVRKYQMLMERGKLSLNSCEDVRNLYNELVLNEVLEEDPENAPDGTWFRKGSVSIYSKSQKEIHKGLYPEEKIIDAMNAALVFLNDESCEGLFRIAVFHYLFEYIHPFYDGNGRLGRFICSYMLSKELEPVIAYRLSYTIKENIKMYDDAFVICNHSRNRGDLTPFLHTFMNIVKMSIEKLRESLEEGERRLILNLKRVPEMVLDGDEKMMCLYDLLIQAALFSEFGVPTSTIMGHVGISRGTLNKYIAKIPAEFLVKNKKGNANYYSMNLDAWENR